MDPPCHVHILTNGIKVVMVPRKASCLMYISLVMRNGMIDETEETWSYTHMGEHLFAQFTSDAFPQAVGDTLGYLGIENNAYTAKFYTGYWLMGHKRHVHFLIRLLSSAFFEYRFADSWEKQRNILLEELKGRSDQWMPLTEAISKVLYPKHALGTSLKEDMTSIQHASECHVIQYMLSRLDPRCTLLLVEGDFEIQQLLPALVEVFDRPKASVGYEQRFHVVPVLKGPKLVRCPISSTLSSRIVYTFQLVGLSIFDNTLDAALTMMMQYFCTGYYSRLYQVLREKYGLIYSLESSHELSPVPEMVPGELTITVQVDPVHVQSVLEIIDKELDDLKNCEIEVKEVTRLKNNLQFKSSMENLNKRPGKYVEYYAHYLAWNQPIQTYKEYYELLKNVKAADIQCVARRVFRPEHLLIAIGHPDDG